MGPSRGRQGPSRARGSTQASREASSQPQRGSRKARTALTALAALAVQLNCPSPSPTRQRHHEARQRLMARCPQCGMEVTDFSPTSTTEPLLRALNAAAHRQGLPHRSSASPNLCLSSTGTSPPAFEDPHLGKYEDRSAVALAYHHQTMRSPSARRTGAFVWFAQGTDSVTGIAGR